METTEVVGYAEKYATRAKVEFANESKIPKAKRAFQRLLAMDRAAAKAKEPKPNDPFSKLPSGLMISSELASPELPVHYHDQDIIGYVMEGEY